MAIHRSTIPLSGALLCAALLAQAAFAQQSPRLTPAEEAPDPLEKLDRLERQIIEDKNRAQILTKSSAELEADQKRLAQDLVRVAASAQAHERDLMQIEQQLAVLETREAEAGRALMGKRGKLASMLAVLQRMGREPPPALIVRPDDAAVAARSAMLLSAVVPAVQSEASHLADGLRSLRKLRQDVASKRLSLAQTANSLQRDRRTLETLIRQKRELGARTTVALNETTTRLTRLAGQARDLKGLIASLEEDAQRPGSAGGQLITDRVASAGAARIASLDGLRGLLALPANGELLAPFGGDDGFGGHLAGILLRTRPGAQVTSPCDGKVLFAGPFRGYGQMLIIGVSGGYHVLISGLAAVDGVVGQEVLAGEPVGRASSDQGTNQAQGASRAQGNPDGGPGDKGGRLYIEFRRNGTPVDPAPWFAALREKASG